MRNLAGEKIKEAKQNTFVLLPYRNQVENLKLPDQLSKRAKKIGLIDSTPETITINLNKKND